MSTQTLAPEGSGTKEKSGIPFRRKAIEGMDDTYLAFKTKVIHCLASGEEPASKARKLHALIENLPAQLRDALSVSIDFSSVFARTGE
jgi:hypothetical protein